MNMVDIAEFFHPVEAGVLESILSAENIPFFLNNQNGAVIVPGTGARLSVEEGDVLRTIQIIKEAGFEFNLLTE